MKRWIVIAAAGVLAASHAAAGELEEAVVAEMNLARTQPQKYARFLRTLRGEYRGKERLQGNVRIRTSEGVRAVDEAIGFLSRQKPLPPLTAEAGLAAAAAELAAEQAASGGTGHRGMSGGLPERVAKHGAWQGSIGENISYGMDEGREVVMALIVDDGVPGRGHRRNIFSPAFRKAGAACAPHPGFRTVCVIDFAGAFEGK
ncbi:MAG TPA: CAP domain-containing protein [Verrucomicrobiae bacterium]|nr:CAP domain-containing protein [Verrucomicrobiae bacterium]